MNRWARYWLRWSASNALGAAGGQMGGLVVASLAVTSLAVTAITVAQGRSVRALVEKHGRRSGEPAHPVTEADVLLAASIGVQEGLLRAWL